MYFGGVDIETDFWLQVIDDWDRGHYYAMTPEGAWHTLDDSLIINPRIEWFPERSHSMALWQRLEKHYPIPPIRLRLCDEAANGPLHTDRIPGIP